jgi:lipid II:glycine glycyltransferase (peptidoglycan interpeptide bridge formation enzyme)
MSRRPSSTSGPGLRVGAISAADHLRHIEAHPGASFLQCPSWGAVKTGWKQESLGWFQGDVLVGAGLVLLRPVPLLNQFLAYLPEGPDIDWTTAINNHGLREWLDPMLSHLKARGAFMVKMGPHVVMRRWSAATIKAALAQSTEGSGQRLRDVPPDASHEIGLNLVQELRASGWRQEDLGGAGFGDVQPRYVFQIPLHDRSEADVLASFNQLWRRNIKKADASGVVVTHGGRNDLAAFHGIYVETAKRDSFNPRPLSYFERMWDAMTAEAPDRIRLVLAHHEGRLLAAATQVNVGTHSWYSYGASTTQGREFRPSNAMQWRMIRDAMNEGRTVYDMRGISDTLDPSDPLIGLVQFKVGTGGEAVEYVGEWDYVLRPAMAFAVNQYLRRR